MINVFSFVASYDGEKSHTAKLSDSLAAAFRKRAEAAGETVSYERMCGDQLDVKFCRGCERCFKEGVCPLDSVDDMAMLKQRILDCDVLLFGSPVYSGSMSGLAKTIFDRTAYWTHRFDLLGKPCLVFMTASSNHGEAVQEMEDLLQYHELATVSAGTFFRHAGHPMISAPDEAEADIAQAAEQLFAAWQNPCDAVSERQQSFFLTRVILNRRALRLARETGNENAAPYEARLCEERGINRYVLLTEAIEALGHKARKKSAFREE